MTSEQLSLLCDTAEKAVIFNNLSVHEQLEHEEYDNCDPNEDFFAIYQKIYSENPGIVYNYVTETDRFDKQVFLGLIPSA